jgi:hypothetical protein
MDPAPGVGSGAPGPNRPFRFGLKGLLVLVASLGLICWASVRVWDTLEGNESLHQIRSKDVSERRAAAMSLRLVTRDRDVGPRAGSVIPALIAAYDRVLKSKEHVIGQSAISDALGKVAASLPCAPAAVAILVRGIDSKDPWVRRGSAMALGRFGRAASAAVPRLKALREDADPNVREAAAKSLATLNVPPDPNAGDGRIAGKSAG